MTKLQNKILALKTFLVLATLMASWIFVSSVYGGKQAGVMALYALCFGGGMSLFTIIVAGKKFKNWQLTFLLLVVFFKSGFLSNF